MTYTKNQILQCKRNSGGTQNLWYSNDRSVVDIEDESDGNDLLKLIKRLKLMRKFTLDRENDKRIRFKCTDCWGNVSYLEVIR